MLNKKAQTAIGLMPLIAIVMSIATLIAMYSFSEGLESKSAEISDLLENIELNHKYIQAQIELIAEQTAKECINCEAEQLKEKFISISSEKESLFRYEGAGNFYGKIRNGEFEIEEIEGKYFLKIEDLFVESQNGYNKIKRNFDVEVELK